MGEMTVSVFSLAVSFGALAVSCFTAISSIKLVRHQRRLNLISLRNNALVDGHEQVYRLENSIRLSRDAERLAPDEVKEAIRAQVRDKENLIGELESLRERLETVNLGRYPMNEEVEECITDVASYMKVVIARCRRVEDGASRILTLSQIK